MSRPRGMISPSGRGILSSRGLVSPTRCDYSDDNEQEDDDDHKTINMSMMMMITQMFNHAFP